MLHTKALHKTHNKGGKAHNKTNKSHHKSAHTKKPRSTALLHKNKRGFSALITTTPPGADDEASLQFFPKISNEEWQHSPQYKENTLLPQYGQQNAFIQSQTNAMKAILSHPMGRTLMSHWVANHISLHLQHVLSHAQDPTCLSYRTKSGALLVGYDVNTEYNKDLSIQGEVKETQAADLPHTSPELLLQAFPDLDVNNPDDVNAAIVALAHARKKTAKLPLSYDQDKVIIKGNKQQIHLSPADAAKLTWVDHGYLHYDPTVKGYHHALEEYHKKVTEYNDWVKTCGLTPQQMASLQKKLQEEEEEKQAAAQALLEEQQLEEEELAKIKEQQRLIDHKQSVAQFNALSPVEQLDQTPWGKLTREEKFDRVAKYTLKAAMAAAYLTYHTLANAVSLFFPSAAKKLLQRLVAPLTLQNFIKCSVWCGFHLKHAAITGATKISAVFGEYLQNTFFPQLQKTTHNFVYNTLRDPIMTCTKPFLKAVLKTKYKMYNAADFVDEWLGTDYVNKVRKLHQKTQFTGLSQLQQPPGPAPDNVEPAPYQTTPTTNNNNNNTNKDQQSLFPTPLSLYDHIRTADAADAEFHISTADLLKVAGADPHTILHSYVAKLRNKNNTKVTLGVVPTDFSELPSNVFEPQYDPRVGAVVEHPFKDEEIKIPEFVLMTQDIPLIFQNARLPKQPDVWLSQRIMDKIPAPHLGDMAKVIQKFDPSFVLHENNAGQFKYVAKKTKAKGVDGEDVEGGDDNDADGVVEEEEKTAFFKTLITAFAVGFSAVEAYYIWMELSAAFETFPDVPRGDLTADYFKFYGIRMKAALLTAIDQLYGRISGGEHLFEASDLYSAFKQQEQSFDSNYQQQHHHQQYNNNQNVPNMSEEELNAVLQSIREQLELQFKDHNGEQPEFTMLTPEQLNAIIQAQNSNQQALEALSLNPADAVNVHNTPSGYAHVAEQQPLSAEDVAHIEAMYPKLREQVSHPFGLAAADVDDYQQFVVEGKPMGVPQHVLDNMDFTSVQAASLPGQSPQQQQQTP